MLVRFLGAITLLLMGFGTAPRLARAGVPLSDAEVEQVLAEVIAEPQKPESFARFLAVLPALDALSVERQAAWLGKVAAARGSLSSARAAFELMAFQAKPDARALGLVDGAADGWWAVADVDADADPAARMRAFLDSEAASLGQPLDGDDPSRVWEPVVTGPRGLMAAGHLIVPGLDQVALVLGRVCFGARRDVVMRLGLAGDAIVALDGAIIGRANGLGGATLDQLEVPLTGAAGAHLVAIALKPIDQAPPLARVRFTDTRDQPIDVRCTDDAPRTWTRAADREGELAAPGVIGQRGHPYEAVARALLGWPDSGLGDVLEGDGTKLAPIDYALAASALERPEARMSALARRGDEAPSRRALIALASDRGQVVRARELLARVPAGEVRTWLEVRAGVRAAPLTNAGGAERDVLASVRAALDAGRADLAAQTIDQLLAVLPSPERLDIRASAQRVFLAAGRPDDAVALAERTALERPDRVLLALDAVDKMIYRRRPAADVRAALSALDAHARWQPDALVQAGRAWEAIGEGKAAIDRYQRALVIQPASEDARQRLEALQGEDPVPLSVPLDAVAKLAPMDPDAPWEVMSEELYVKVADDGSATRWLRRVMRAQHPPSAREDRTFRWRFDPSQDSVRVLGARVIQPDGKSVPVREREISTLAEDWYGLYFDVRVLTVPFDGLVPDSLVEVTLRIDTIGQHFPGVFEHIEVLRDRVPKHLHLIVVDAPSALGLHAKTMAGPGDEHLVERRESANGRDRLIMEARDIPALGPESLAPGASEVSAVWQVTSFDSWVAVGRWYRQVLSAQAVVTPAMKARVAAIQAAEKNEPTRVAAALVALVQQEIRYVGLEFGIHGYKPYRTDQVWARRFGDCKDQALLLKTLLTEANIAADVVLVRTRTQGRIGLAGDGPLPSLAIFDHAIVWLRERGQFVDSTIVHTGMNELPAPDQGAQVLLIDGASERVTLTPADPATRNQVIGNYSITIDQTGFGGIQGTVAFLGAQAPYYRALLADPATQTERLQAVLNRRYPGLALESARVSDPEVVEAPVELVFHAGVPRLATAVGQALHVLRPAGIDGQAERVASSATRAQPVVLGPPMAFDLTFRYVVPSGFVAKELPDSGEGASRFGTWSVTWTQEAGVVQVVTRLRWLVDQVEPRDYAALRTFIRGFDAAVGPALVLERAP